MSAKAPRRQPDPTSDFDAETSSHPSDADLWESFQAAQGAAARREGGSAPNTDEQLPPGGGPVELRPLQQQFQEQRPPDPTSAFGAAAPMSRPGEADGTSTTAIIYFSPDTCAEYGRWGTRGWWNIPPNGEAHVLNTNNDWSYIYAEADDGSLWTDMSGPRMYVRRQAFDSCLLIATPRAEWSERSKSGPAR
ncbi:hypothetical protein ACIHCQ_09130 [Streptomyces sp. NPDC052236]|uniref:hypothetical protein n=1 Tax=Streptomyces sp. NPDC052236 TaxID=3365686 RepID=UPI0037D23622